MKFIQVFLAALFIFSIVSCSTMEGMGKDLQSLGKTIEKTAGPAKPTEAKPAEQPSSGAVVTPIQ
jgi:predicted small secreted protein